MNTVNTVNTVNAVNAERNDFKTRVFNIVGLIPRGKVITYKEVAIAVGKPGAARAVGNILRGNYNPLIPCHRVVRSDGKPGGYNRGEANKINLLKKEGVNYEKR